MNRRANLTKLVKIGNKWTYRRPVYTKKTGMLTSRVRHNGKDAELGGSFVLRWYEKWPSAKAKSADWRHFGRYQRTQKTPEAPRGASRRRPCGGVAPTREAVSAEGRGRVSRRGSSEQGQGNLAGFQAGGALFARNDDEVPRLSPRREREHTRKSQRHVCRAVIRHLKLGWECYCAHDEHCCITSRGKHDRSHVAWQNESSRRR